MISIETIEDAEAMMSEILTKACETLRAAGLEGQARGVDSCRRLPPSAPCVGKTLNNVAMTVRMAHDLKARDPECPEAVAAEAVALASAASSCLSGKFVDVAWMQSLARRLVTITNR